MHIIIGLVIVALVLILEKDFALITVFILFCLSILFSLSVIFFRKVTRFPPIRFFLERLGRNYDKARFPAKGLVFFLAGSLLVLKLFTQDIALTAITVLAFGDSISTLVGLFGKARYNGKFLNNYKTFYGTLLGILISFIIALLFIEPLYALIGAVFGMISEAISIKLGEEQADDNIIVPLFAGGSIYLAKLIGI